MVNFKKLRQMIEVKGNGNIVSREIKVSSFIRLHVSGRGVVELHQSDTEHVVIETDENLQDCFQVENSGRTLYVSAEGTFRKPVYTHCTIRIYLRQIDVLYIRNDGANLTCANELKLSGPLEIKVQSVGNTALHIHAPAIKMLCQTQGNVSIKGSCERIDIKNQSQGDFDSAELMAGSLVIKNMSEGNVDLYAIKDIAISHYGHGHIHYSGPAVLKDVKQYGDGEVVHTGS